MHIVVERCTDPLGDYGFPEGRVLVDDYNGLSSSQKAAYPERVKTEAGVNAYQAMSDEAFTRVHNILDWAGRYSKVVVDTPYPDSPVSEYRSPRIQLDLESGMAWARALMVVRSHNTQKYRVPEGRRSEVSVPHTEYSVVDFGLILPGRPSRITRDPMGDWADDQAYHDRYLEGRARLPHHNVRQLADVVRLLNTLTKVEDAYITAQVKRLAGSVALAAA